MFWGLIMEPQRRYTQQVKKAFHISMASLDISTSSEEPAQVMCGFEGRNYLLCTLRKPDVMQCSLDLNFNVGSELSFASNGKCHVHLTGYLIDEYPELAEEEEIDVEEEEEQQEKKVKKKNKKRNNKDNIQNGPPPKKSKGSSSTKVVEEEAEEEEDEDSEDSEVTVNDLLKKSFDENDDDESYVEEDESEEEEVANEESDDEEEEEESEGEGASSSMSEDESDEQENQSPTKNKTKVNGVPVRQEQSTPKPKKVKGNKEQEVKEEKTPNKASQPKKRTVSGGVIVEEIKEGQGQVAKHGKFVTVYYEGRLKQNNKLFDSTTKGNGFSFRLGSGEVIKAWDVGVVGMRCGGKRRITCPPAMAYGQKGSPPAIPSNSTLVFEVELKKIR